VPNSTDGILEGFAAIAQEAVAKAVAKGLPLWATLHAARVGHREWERLPVTPNAGTRAIGAAIGAHRRVSGLQLSNYVLTSPAKIDGKPAVAVHVETIGSPPLALYARIEGDQLGPWQRDEAATSIMLAD
jgi:hypothetical protein